MLSNCKNMQEVTRKTGGPSPVFSTLSPPPQINRLHPLVSFYLLEFLYLMEARKIFHPQLSSSCQSLRARLALLEECARGRAVKALVSERLSPYGEDHGATSSQERRFMGFLDIISTPTRFLQRAILFFLPHARTTALPL